MYVMLCYVMLYNVCNVCSCKYIRYIPESGDSIWLQAWLSCLQLMDAMEKRQLHPGASECPWRFCWLNMDEPVKPGLKCADIT